MFEYAVESRVRIRGEKEAESPDPFIPTHPQPHRATNLPNRLRSSVAPVSRFPALAGRLTHGSAVRLQGLLSVVLALLPAHSFGDFPSVSRLPLTVRPVGDLSPVGRPLLAVSAGDPRVARIACETGGLALLIHRQKSGSTARENHNLTPASHLRHCRRNRLSERIHRVVSRYFTGDGVTGCKSSLLATGNRNLSVRPVIADDGIFGSVFDY